MEQAPEQRIARQLTTVIEAKDRLDSLGYRRREIPPDGNCLYRACAEICLGSQAESQSLREQVHDYIVSHRDRFEPFIEGEDFHTYVAKIEKDGEWGSDLELQAISEITKTTFTVHANNRPQVTFSPQDTLLPEHHGALWFSHGNHYDALYTPEEFESRGFSAGVNDELASYRTKRLAEEEASMNLSRELSEETALPGPTPDDGELSEIERQNLIAAGITEEELASQMARSSTSGRRSVGPIMLSEEQRRRPTIANLLNNGFSEAELAQQFASENPPAPLPPPPPRSSVTLPPDLLAREDVLGLLQAGVSEEDIRRQFIP